MQKFQGDFKESDPNLNCSKWLPKTHQLATAGDDKIIRVYSFHKNGKEFDLKKQMKEDFVLKGYHT